MGGDLIPFNGTPGLVPLMTQRLKTLIVPAHRLFGNWDNFYSIFSIWLFVLLCWSNSFVSYSNGLFFYLEMLSH